MIYKYKSFSYYKFYIIELPKLFIANDLPTDFSSKNFGYSIEGKKNVSQCIPNFKKSAC